MIKNGKELYLYGIIPLKSGEIAGCEGIGGFKVYAEPVGGVSLLISRFSDGLYEIELEDAIKHVRVLEKVMDQMPVIPIRFGTVIKSMDVLTRTILANTFKIKNELQRLSSKFEVGVKAYWKKEFIQQELANAFKDHAQLTSKASTDQQAAVELGQRVESIVEMWRERFKDTHHLLSGFATDSYLGEPISVEMVYNGSFLVDIRQEVKLKQNVLEIGEKLSEKFSFHYTTHLPPYNFVALDLNWGNRK